MTEIVDNTITYEMQRSLLGNVSLRDRRISMMQSRGLTEIGEEDVLKKLNGSSYTPLRQFLEETLYRPK